MLQIEDFNDLNVHIGTKKQVSARTYLNKYVNHSREIKDTFSLHRPRGSNESIQLPATRGDDHGCQQEAKKEVANRDQGKRAAARSIGRRGATPKRSENGLPFLGLQRYGYCRLICSHDAAKNNGN